MTKYAIISNPVTISQGVVGGHIVSRHRTLRGMARAMERHQAPTRKANPGCHLNLQPVEMTDQHHGRIVSTDECVAVLFELQG